MTFEDFEKRARLHAVGALEDEEVEVFEQARKEFGVRAEDYIQTCQNLGAAFALSLHPQPPALNARERLMSLICRAICGGQTRE